MTGTSRLALALCFGLAAELGAQQPAPLPLDSLAALAALPTPEQQRRILDAAATDEAWARSAVDEVRTKRERAQYLIDIQKAEINTLGKRIDHAKNEKRADDQKRTETEKKGLELKLRTLERWRDVWDAAIGVSEAKRDAA